MSSINKGTIVSIFGWRVWSCYSDNQPDTTAVAVLVTAEKSTSKTQRIELASAPRSSRRILSSHLQRAAKKRQFLAGFGILLHAIDARSHKRKQDAQEKPNCQSDKHDQRPLGR
jgi:hypothetical protein